MITLPLWQRGSLDSGAEYWTAYPHHLRPFVYSVIHAYQQDFPGLLANALEDLRCEVGIAVDELGLCDSWWDRIEAQELDLIAWRESS